MISVNAISFREADLRDADAIGAIHVASWRETYSGILPEVFLRNLSAEARSAMWGSMLNRSGKGAGTAVFLAESGRAVVGFGACGGQRDQGLREQGFDGEIGAIYVLEAHQRIGVGSILMRLMAGSLVRQGRSAASL